MKSFTNIPPQAETSAKGQGLGQLWNLFDILSSLSDLGTIIDALLVCNS